MKRLRHARGRVLMAVVLGAILSVGMVHAASASTPAVDPAGSGAVDAPAKSQGGILLRDSTGSAEHRAQAPTDAATGGIAGTVLDYDGIEMEGVTVSAYLSSGDPSDPVTFVGSALSDVTGAYTLDALPVGDYDLLFIPPNQGQAGAWRNGGPSPSIDAPLTVMDGETTLAGVQYIEPSFPISGRVTGGLSKKPLDGATVRLWASSGEASGWWFYQVDEVTTSADGSFEFLQNPSGWYTFEFVSPTNQYKGEFWQNKPSFAESNVFTTASRTSYFAESNLQERVSLGTISVSGASATGSKLTATFPTQSGVSYRYQWYANGNVINGATAKTFVPTPSQEHATVTVKVKAMKTGMISTTKASEPRAKILLTAIPSITGKAAVGSTLKGWTNRWTTGATLRYQWYANGVAIADATGKTYVLKSNDRGKRITLKVSGSKEGYGSFARTSPAAGPVS